jgi:chromosome segregation ATPase
MEAANLQTVTEDAGESVPGAADPVGDIHAKIATAFAAPDAPLAETPYGEVANRFAGAAERHTQAVAQTQQLDREELDSLREALRDLCEGTLAISSYTEQRFAEVSGRITASDGALATLSANQATQATGLETVHGRLNESGAILERLGTFLEAVQEKSSQMEASVQASLGTFLEAAQDKSSQMEASVQASLQTFREAAREKSSRAEASIQASLETFREAAQEKSSQMEASIQALQEQNGALAVRQDDIQAAISRLEEVTAALGQRLESLAGLSEPIEVLRGQNADMANQQRTLGRTVDLVLEHTEAARTRDTTLEQRITAAEERISASVDRLEAVCNWQSRLGKVLSGGLGA